MAREKKPVHKVQMTEGKRNIIQQLLQESDSRSHRLSQHYPAVSVGLFLIIALFVLRK